MSNLQPNLVERIVCLANSRKTLGRCIAGKRIDSNSNVGLWVRPVSARQAHEISEDDRRYQDGGTAQLFEVIDIPCIKMQPQGHQPENVLIDDRFYWRSNERVTWDQLQDMVDPCPRLWESGYGSYYGENNRVPGNILVPNEGSLKLIALGKITLHAGPKAPDFGNMKFVVRGSFEFAGVHYKMDVTDPYYESRCLKAGTGEYVLNSVLVCVSLGERYTDGYAYKLLASLITEERANS